MSPDFAAVSKDDPTDAVFTVTGGKVTLTALKNGVSTVNAENYTYSDATDRLTIKGTYLGTLTAGDKTFTLVTNVGDFEVEISVVDTSPTTDTFSKAAADDIAVTITGTTDLIQVKNGSTVLTKDTDYTVAAGVVTLKKEYFSAQENGDVVITFVTGVGSFTCTVTVGD